MSSSMLDPPPPTAEQIAAWAEAEQEAERELAAADAAAAEAAAAAAAAGVAGGGTAASPAPAASSSKQLLFCAGVGFLTVACSVASSLVFPAPAPEPEPEPEVAHAASEHPVPVSVIDDLIRAGSYPEALAQCRRALTEHPPARHRGIAYREGLCLETLGRLKEAGEAYRRAEPATGDRAAWAGAVLGRVRCAIASDDLASAQSHLERVALGTGHPDCTGTHVYEEFLFVRAWLDAARSGPVRAMDPFAPTAVAWPPLEAPAERYIEWLPPDPPAGPVGGPGAPRVVRVHPIGAHTGAFEATVHLGERPVADVIRALAGAAELKLEMTPPTAVALAKPVVVDVEAVPLDELLDTLVAHSGAGWALDGDRLTVTMSTAPAPSRAIAARSFRRAVATLPIRLKSEAGSGRPKTDTGPAPAKDDAGAAHPKPDAEHAPPKDDAGAAHPKPEAEHAHGPKDAGAAHPKPEAEHAHGPKDAGAAHPKTDAGPAHGASGAGSAHGPVDAPWAQAARVWLANFEFDAGRPRDAAKAYQQLVDETVDVPEAPYAAYNLGLLELRAGGLQSARSRFVDLVDRAPRSRWADYAWWWVGRTHLDVGDFASARRAFRTALEGRTREVTSAAALATCALALMDGTDEQARDALDGQRSDARPEHAALRGALEAVVRYRTSPTPGRRTVLLGALRDSGDGAALGPGGTFFVGRIYRDLGLTDRTIALYDAASLTTRGPLAQRMTYDAAEWYDLLDRVDEARQRYMAIAATDPTGLGPKAELRLADLALRERKGDECLRRCRALLGHAGADRAAVLMLMGRAYELQKNYRAAADCFAGRVPDE